MIKMLRNIIGWLIYFGLSFLISDKFGWTSQGRAFFYIYIGFDILIFVLFVAFLTLSAFNKDLRDLAGLFTFEIDVLRIVDILITLLASYITTKLLNVDYFKAFQIMTLGQCICLSYTYNKET